MAFMVPSVSYPGGTESSEALYAQFTLGCVASRLILAEFGFEICKSPGLNRAAHLRHECQVVGEVVERQQHRPQHLPGLDQMMEISPAIAGGIGALGGRVERTRVFRMHRPACPHP